MNKISKVLFPLWVAFLLIGHAAFGAVVPDTANKFSVYNLSSTNPQVTATRTIGVGDNLDTIVIQSYAGAEASVVACGTNNYTMLSDQAYDNYYRSVWYVLNPTTGTCAISITNSSLLGANFIAAVSWAGANTALGAGVFGTSGWPGTLGWVHDSNGGVLTAGTWSATATGAGSNDAYFGTAFAAMGGGSGNISDNNSNMVNLGIQGDSGNNNFSFDYILGSHAGLMSYASTTGGTSVNVVFAVAIFGTSGGSSCTDAGYTSSGTSATPNGSSGSYVGKSGPFVTPDCNGSGTIFYWAPPIGNFTRN